MAAERGAAWALFLDFDGTLVEIAERPDAVVIGPELPDLLSGLRERCGGALAIVTGRPLADVDRFLPGLSLDGCGTHGLERRVAGQLAGGSPLREIGPEVERLRRRLQPFEGVLIEDKGVGVAVHWRMAPERREEVVSALDEVLAGLGPGYRIQDGKAVREIVPDRAGKGAGILALLDRAPYRGRRPVFIGDDVTDEHGFAAVNGAGGVSVKVGPGPTAATCRLADVTAVRRWLSGPLDIDVLPPA